MSWTATGSICWSRWRGGRELLARLGAEAAGFDAREAALRTSLARSADETQAAEAQVTAAQAALDGLRGDLVYQRLSDARTAVVVARETWEHRRVWHIGRPPADN